MITEADLEHGYHPYTAVDRVCVFRNPTGWSTLTITRDVRYDDYDRPISGNATVTTSEFATLDELERQAGIPASSGRDEGPAPARSTPR